MPFGVIANATLKNDARRRADHKKKRNSVSILTELIVF
jgi:hypothetical protein